ncbi:MAG: CDP-diacylglycerol--glycerol-3-phosphate 3-phosphatidyltransferase [Lachnospiraceae bacterium]|nr:CDP-diacylglycerol--glycerol-3-phosphate 3-phosphatidyltransferase [Lachnospiraceae bacterium]
MNLPNKLTTIRMILVVPFVIFLLGGHSHWGWFDFLFGGILEYMDWVALVIFVVASLTDLLDGRIARKYHMVTNFGKFMDPLADKLLVCSALICLIELGRIPSWAVIVIVGREFIISGFRLVASDNGIVIAASMWGKYKTTFQMIMIILMIADIEQLSLITVLVMWIALILTIVSLVDYIRKNRQVLTDFK